MAWYVLKLLFLLPLIGGLIWGSLKLSQFMQSRLGGPAQARSVRVAETLMLSPGTKLAVIEFHDRRILVSVSRNGINRLAEVNATEVEV